MRIHTSTHGGLGERAHECVLDPGRQGDFLGMRAVVGHYEIKVDTLPYVLNLVHWPLSVQNICTPRSCQRM